VNAVDIDGLMSCGCVVQSFGIKSHEWTGNLPNKGTWIRDYTKHLKIVFELQLAPGSDAKYCRIKQDRRGIATDSIYTSSNPIWQSSVWVNDPGEIGKVPQPYWWSGQMWSIDNGSWSAKGNSLTATFGDEPGIDIPHRTWFPVLFDVDFNTQVLDAFRPGTPVVASIPWGIEINYSSISSGFQGFTILDYP